MITNIIFDLGGVLIPEKGAEITAIIATRVGVSSQTLDDALTPWKEKMTKGDITLREVYEKIQEILEQTYDPEEIVATHLKVYHDLSRIRETKIIEMIERLKEKYTVVALTNTEPEIAEFNKTRRAEEDGKTLFEYFHRAFISTEMHMKKPDAEIYEAMLHELECTSEQVIFIDDKQMYVDGARKVGIRSILYQNPKQLKEELGAIGISV